MRTVDLVRAALGLVELMAPTAVLGVVGTGPADGTSRVVVRLLGGRHLLQAVLTAARPTPATRRVGAAVDASHAASMLVLAAASRPHRRAALCSAVTASALVAAGLRAP